MRNRIVLTDDDATSLGTETVLGDEVLKVSVVKTVGGGGSGGTVDQGAAGLDPWLFELPVGASTEAKQDTIIGHVDGIEALLAGIDSDTQIIAGAVSGTEMQVDVLTMPTTTVQATNFDIRDLVAATDSVSIHGDVGIFSQFDLANSNPATVAIVDSNGDQITSFGGGVQYTEGDTDASITGTAILMEGAANTLLTVPGTTADGLLVNLGSNNDVTVTGSVTANAGTNLNTSALALETGGNLAAAATSLAIIDDWDETDRAKVNPIVGQAGVQGASGAVSATTQRVVLATDVALPTGSNVIGHVIADTGSTTAVTGNVTVVQGTSTNLKADITIAAAQTLATVTTVGTVTTVTNVVHVDDNAGSLTVDNGGTFAVQATIAAGAAAIAKAEDVGAADGDVGVPAMAVRKATPANTSGSDGDYEMIQMSAGRLWVDPSGVTLTVASHAVTNAGTFVVQENGAALTALQKIDDPVIVDDAAFTPATSSVMMMGAEFDDSSPDSVDEGDAGAVRMSGNRNLYVRIRDNAGNERGLNIDANGAIAATVTNATATNLKAEVIGTGTFAVQATIASGATSIAKAEDVLSADGDVGVPALAVRKATPANTSGTDGDYEFLQMSAGRLWASATIDAALPAGTNAIGKLSANAGVTIGAVEIAAAQTLSTVTTVSTVTAVTAISNALPTGTNTIGGVTSRPSSSSSDAPTRAVSTALEASRVIKASAGNLYTITGLNTKTSSQFIQVFNNSSLPADGAGTLIYTFTVSANSNFSLDFGTLGEQFSTGIVVTNSSTAATKTIGSADCWFVARYS